MDELVGYEEAARALGVSAVTVWRLVKAGELEQVKVGSRTLYRRSDLSALIRRRSVGTSRAALHDRQGDDGAGAA
jgi:excisionase family DNA binding protein